MYSKRRGTVAEKLPDQVPIDIKRKRVNILLNLQKEITRQNNEKLQGAIFEVIVEEKIKDGVFLTRTDCGKTIEVFADELPILSFQKVKVLKVLNNKLQGLIGD